MDKIEGFVQTTEGEGVNSLHSGEATTSQMHAQVSFTTDMDNKRIKPPVVHKPTAILGVGALEMIDDSLTLPCEQSLITPEHTDSQQLQEITAVLKEKNVEVPSLSIFYPYLLSDSYAGSGLEGEPDEGPPLGCEGPMGSPLIMVTQNSSQADSSKEPIVGQRA